MIARRRGDERIHNRWRPAVAAGVAPRSWNPETAEQLDPDPPESHLPDSPAPAPRRSRTLIGIAVLVAVAAIASHQGGKSAASSGLPSTPRQWVDQWTAASLENPARVCQHLFAPALAAAFKPDSGRTCQANYSQLTSSSFHIRHILQDGPTAAVEAQQLGHGRRWGYFTLILSHVHDGWQAIDIVPGGSVRPR
jgi:hypothetical protein